MRIRASGPVVVGLLFSLPAAADVLTSKHNLSVTGQGGVQPNPLSATTEPRICVFCHTPHTSFLKVPLWNHALSKVSNYATYSSTTMSLPTPLDQPTGVSKLCLSCHDGTVALGQTVYQGTIALQGTGPGGTIPAGRSNLGTDLTDDHPISFRPNLLNSEIRNPPPGDPVQLDEGGEIQCTSCHDPHKEDHDPVLRRFLVKNNRASAICTTCHQLERWESNPSSHQSSTSLYSEQQGAHTGYATVQDNGCESCHRPHTGLAPQRLLKFPEEETCDPCHNGEVAARDVAADFQKPYAHPTYSTTPSVHDASESPFDASFPLPEPDPGSQRHAECPDCHDAHASFQAKASAPELSGALSGTWGIDSSGALADPATTEYQICFKCHGDSGNKPQEIGLPNPPYTQRRIVQFNTRLEFDPLNPSQHAVVGPGPNPNVPSLLPPYTTASVIYCTDCHNSDTSPAGGGGGANGPHGSMHNHLLERNLNTGDGNSGSDFSSMYALCFKCHSEASILGDESFKEHRRHIDQENSSCMVCHDPHGVSATQGNSINNSHLINFDISIVFPNRDGLLEFVDTGTFSGTCSLTCHNKNHDLANY